MTHLIQWKEKDSWEMKLAGGGGGGIEIDFVQKKHKVCPLVLLVKVGLR
jgi:hypothetical protein